MSTKLSISIGITANIYADVLKSTKAKVADLIALKLA